jgi:hypothetical protein
VVEDGVRGVHEHPPDLALALDRLHCDPIELSDDLRLLQAVGEHLLAVDDRLGILEAGEHGPLCHLVQEPVAARHDAKQCLQLQVAGQRPVVRRQVPLQVEALVGMHEEGLHWVMRLLRGS